MKFNYKVFTSLLLTWCFVILMISGIVLFISPPGRIANWTDWSIWGLTKQKWTGIHNLSAVVFLTAGLFHLLKFNWSLFWCYLVKMPARTSSSRELVGSLVLTLVVLGGTIFGLQPFSGFLSLGETAKNSWEDTSLAPPVAHMELLSIGEIATRLSMSPEKAVDTLKSAGIGVLGPEQKLQDLAAASGKSPLNLYNLLLPKPAANGGHPVGGGLGQKTIAQAAKDLLLTPEEALEALKSQGIQASADDKVRDAAEKAGKRAFDLVEIMRSYKKK